MFSVGGFPLPAVAWLHWAGGAGKHGRQAPDFLVRRADGTDVLVDVRPDAPASRAD
jgi:hypothetical protein